MCSVCEIGLSSKTGSKGYVIKLELKGPNFERTHLKPLPREPSHKFKNVRIEWNGMLSQKEESYNVGN
jgi:hypothetical protein